MFKGMEKLPDRIEQLLRSSGGILQVANHPRHRHVIAAAARRGQLKRLMRGLYVPVGADTGLVLRAVQAACPRIIFSGAAAAWINGFQVSVPIVTALNAHNATRFPDVVLGTGRLPDSVWDIRNGLRCMTPAMAALDVVPDLGAELIDDFLRRSFDPATALDQLRQALAATPNRRGNRRRREVLARSATNPWSEAERRFHDLLGSAGITGWEANGLIVVDGQRYFGDVVFRAAGLVVDIDGYAFHSDRSAFQVDRTRQNALQAAHWRILRFTWSDITDRPDQAIALIRGMLG